MFRFIVEDNLRFLLEQTVYILQPSDHYYFRFSRDILQFRFSRDILQLNSFYRVIEHIALESIDSLKYSEIHRYV